MSTKRPQSLPSRPPTPGSALGEAPTGQKTPTSTPQVRQTNPICRDSGPKTRVRGKTKPILQRAVPTGACRRVLFGSLPIAVRRDTIS
jgi:hypothetical protein